MAEFVEPSASVSGTAGWITLPAMFWATTSLEIHAASWQGMLDPERIDLPKEGNGYVPMLRSVCAAIRDRLVEHPLHSCVDTVAVFRTLDRIRALITPTHTEETGE